MENAKNMRVNAMSEVRQETIFTNSTFFVIGFTIVFSAVGVLFQTLLSHAPFAIKNLLAVSGGLIIMAFGVLLVASAKYIIPVFSSEHRVLHFKRFKSSYLSSLVFGVGFALGWTPCVGALLGAIYALAAAQPALAFLLLLTYSLGLGLPFLVVGFFISRLTGFMRRIRAFLIYFNVIGGIFLMAMGLLVVTGYIGMLSVFLIGTSGPMSFTSQLNFLFAFIAGVLTFLSPCILPLVPAYLSYMAGTTSEVMRA